MPSILPSVKAHYECAEASGGIQDSVGAENFVEQGTVGSIADGALGLARGPCSGTFGAGGDGFSRSVGLAGPFDYNTGSFSESMWVRFIAATTSQEASAQDGGVGSDAYFFRATMDLGLGNFSPAIFLFDGVGYNIGHASSLGAGAMPTGEWLYVGWGWDRASETLAAWETSSRGVFYETLSTSGSTVFSYTRELVTVGLTRGNSGDGINGDVDQVDFFNKLLSPTEAAYLGATPRPLTAYNFTPGLLLIGG